MKTSCERQNTIDPPQDPCEGGPAVTPCWRADECYHIDESGQPNRKSGHKQALVRMTQDRRKQLWVEGVAQDGDECKDEKQDQIEHEENVGDDVEPMRVVGELVQHDGDNAGRHGDDEPSEQGIDLCQPVIDGEHQRR